MAVCRFNSVIYHSSALTLYLIDSRACAVASFCPAQSHRILSFPKGVAAVAKVRRKKEAKASKTKHKLTEAQIAVHWKEEQYFWPSKKFIAQANLTDPAFVKKFSEKHFPECFDHYASFLDWDKPWRKTLDTSNPPFWKWFVGGKLNACYNCVDRHLVKHKNKAALIFVPEPENEPAVVITYQELYKRVNEVAAMLRDFAELKTGDRVTIHMPMIPELPITMLACARLGIVHSVVFGGFSGEACGLRAADSGSRVLIYADSYYRNGKKIDHKGNADIAVATAKKEGQDIDKVLIWRRYAGHDTSEAPMIMGRDFFVDEVLKDYAGKIVEPVSQDAEAPRFYLLAQKVVFRVKRTFIEAAQLKEALFVEEHVHAGAEREDEDGDVLHEVVADVHQVVHQRSIAAPDVGSDTFERALVGEFDGSAKKRGIFQLHVGVDEQDVARIGLRRSGVPTHGRQPAYDHFHIDAVAKCES